MLNPLSSNPLAPKTGKEKQASVIMTIREDSRNHIMQEMARVDTHIYLGKDSGSHIVHFKG